MRPILLAGIAALLLTTGAAQDAFTCAWPCNDEQRARAGWPGYEKPPTAHAEYEIDVCKFGPTVENSNLDNCVTLSHTTLASCEWIQQNASKHGLTVISGCRRVDQEEKK